MVIRKKKAKAVPARRIRGWGLLDWISLAKESGLIISARVGKHTDEFLAELVANTEGKTDCKRWYTDDWGGYERILPPEMIHIIGKQNTQRLE